MLVSDALVHYANYLRATGADFHLRPGEAVQATVPVGVNRVLLDDCTLEAADAADFLYDYETEPGGDGVVPDSLGGVGAL